MGKLKKSSKSKSASKRRRPFLLPGSLGHAKVVDQSFGSSRTSFRSAISKLKDADFDVADSYSSSDDDAPAGIILAGSIAEAALFSGASSASMLECATHSLAAENGDDPLSSMNPEHVNIAHSPVGESGLSIAAVAAAVAPAVMQTPTTPAACSVYMPRLSSSLDVLSEGVHNVTCSSPFCAETPPKYCASADLAVNIVPAADLGFCESAFLSPKELSTAAVPSLSSDGILPTPAHATIAHKPMDNMKLPASTPLYPLVHTHANQNSNSVKPLVITHESPSSHSVSPSPIKGPVTVFPHLLNSPIHFGDFPTSPLGEPISCSPPAPAKAAISSPSDGCSLFHHKVTPPKEHEILSIPSNISQQGIIAWSLSLVGFFVGGKKSIHYVTFWANKIWGSRVAKVYFKGNGLYIFNFKNEDDMLQILKSGPIFFGKSLMILQRWQPGKDLIKADPSSIPIWINFHNVPLALWHADGFAFLASHFGKPLYLDEITMKGNKLAFARVCVDIEATTTVPSSLRIQIENCVPHEIRVEIPWQPSKCLHCKTYGHSTSSCPSLPRQKVVDQNRSKRKFVWKEVETNKEANPPSPPPPPALPLGSSSGKVKSLPDSISPRHTNTTQNIQNSAPESSASKRVHFDRVDLLIDKVNLAKQDALSTISIPTLKSCLKVSQSGRFPTRLAYLKPP